MKSREISPAAAAILIGLTVIVLLAGGYYFFLRPKRPEDMAPVPPGGYKKMTAEEFRAKREEQFRNYSRMRGATTGQTSPQSRP
jgi:hypothetical protein